jgi:hypothetical protein
VHKTMVCGRCLILPWFFIILSLKVTGEREREREREWAFIYKIGVKRRAVYTKGETGIKI